MVSYSKSECNRKMKELEDRIRAENKDELEKMRNEYKLELDKMQTKTEGKLEELRMILTRKDDEEGKLHQEIGSLKQHIQSLEKSSEDTKSSLDFLTTETTELTGKCYQNKLLAETTSKRISLANEKSRDLEDRQRRNNLIFFNVPESTNQTEREDCEKLIVSELVKCGIFDRDVADNNHLTDRAHRLGRFDKSKTNPRPIIVRVYNFRDKEHILKNSFKLVDSTMNVSEDFSKPTIQLHSELYKAAKIAKETENSGIISFRVLYRRLSLKFEEVVLPNVYNRAHCG
jgi:hypothetical protein